MRPRRPREKWSARASAAASFAISASWHFLVLAVLALAVHPLAPPRETQPVTLELLPPVPPPVEVEPPPPPIPPKPIQIERPPEPLPPQPLEVVRPPPPILSKPLEIAHPPSPVPPRSLQVQRAPAPILLPPEPLEVARPPQPALSKPVEVERRPAPEPPRSLQLDRPALPVPEQAPSEPAPSEAAKSEPAKSEAAPQTTAQLPVLTNERVVQAPIEIRPPARASSPLRNPITALPAAPPLPTAGGPGGAAPPSGAAAGGAAKPFEGRIQGFDDNGVRTGLRMQLGCLNPETYHLGPEERAECLRRLADEAKRAQAMGPNIPSAKQADYDRVAACHSATAAREVPVGGLGANPRLRDCGPGDR